MNETDRLPLVVFPSILSWSNNNILYLNSKLYSDGDKTRKQQERKHVQTSLKTSRTCTTRFENKEKNKEEHLTSLKKLSIYFIESLRFPGLTDCLPAVWWRTTRSKETVLTSDSGKLFAITGSQDVSCNSKTAFSQEVRLSFAFTEPLHQLRDSVLFGWNIQCETNNYSGTKNLFYQKEDSSMPLWTMLNSFADVFSVRLENMATWAQLKF